MTGIGLTGGDRAASIREDDIEICMLFSLLPLPLPKGSLIAILDLYWSEATDG